MRISGPSTSTQTLGKKLFSKKLLPWLMWGCGALFYFYEFMVQVSPNVMGPELMYDFSINANGLGILTGIYFYAYAFMQIPAGLLLDRLGPHRLLACASGILAIGCLLFGTVPFFSLALFARFAIGIGSAFAVVGCMKLAANWFPVNRFALMIGLTVSIGMTGAIIGEAPLASLIQNVHWRACMLYLSGMGVFICLLFIFFVRDYPENSARTFHNNHPSQQTLRSLAAGLSDVIKRPQIWLVACYGFLMFAPTITFCGLWGAPFFIAKYNLSTHDAATLVSFVFIGWIVGSPSTGWLSDRIEQRLPIMIIGATGALSALSMVLYLDELSQASIRILLFFFGLCSSGFLPAFSIIRESSPIYINASALGFMNMMNTLGIAIAQPLVGIVLDALWADGVVDNGVRIYTVLDYQKALSVLPVMIFIAIILSFFIRETYSQIQGTE